jgi:hypothetical protein
MALWVTSSVSPEIIEIVGYLNVDNRSAQHWGTAKHQGGDKNRKAKRSGVHLCGHVAVDIEIEER